MKGVMRIAVAAFVVAAAPLGAQRNTFIVSVYGGGANHLTNLTSNGRAADFAPGYSVGGSLGLEVSRYFAIHGDFTFTRNEARGAVVFNGAQLNRFFYGAHLEARYPVGGGFAPFLFAGGGAASVDQLAVSGFKSFTRPAGMFGAGLFVAIPSTQLELFGEMKTLMYRWDHGDLVLTDPARRVTRTIYDLTYAGGLSYRLPF